MAPQPCPAQSCETRTQQEHAPLRSQGKSTMTRPYLSTQISLPESPVSPPPASPESWMLPTTVAVCGPCTNGLGVRRAGRNGTESGMHVKWFA